MHSGRSDVWWPGVFRALLHRIPDPGRPFVFRAGAGNLTVYWAACGAPTLAWGGTSLRYDVCPGCLPAAKPNHGQPPGSVSPPGADPW